MNIKYQDIIAPIVITKFYSGCRLDWTLSQLLPRYSRSQIKSWILQKKVTINGFIVTIPKKKVFQGAIIQICDVFRSIEFLEAENIPLNIVYEDDFILIINKPSNFIMHPGAGNFSGTLMNALLYHYPTVAIVPRAGIVHRLDKDTTGLILVAKDIPTQVMLVESFRLRKIIREYEAIVVGNIVMDGFINKPIARHVINRACMSVCSFGGKPAITYYQVLENFSEYTRIKLKLETGRTHQIRVHMAHVQHPIVGDQKYGNIKNSLVLKEKYYALNSCFCYNRQALHASMLKFSHPITGVTITCRVSLPQDMLNLLDLLRSNVEK